MKKYFLFISSLVLMVACSSAPEEDVLSTVENDTAVVEDDVAVADEGFVLVQAGDREKGDQNDVYSGSATVSGQYTYIPENVFFTSFFVLSDDSKNLVPTNDLISGEFIFRNEDVNAMFGIEDENSESCDGYVVDATIRIEGYNLNILEGEAMDSTTLVDIIEKSEPVCKQDL